MIVETPVHISFLMFSLSLAFGLVAVLNWKRADKRAHAVLKRVSPGNDSPWYYKVGIVARLILAVYCFGFAAFFLVRVITGVFSG